MTDKKNPVRKPSRNRKNTKEKSRDPTLKTTQAAPKNTQMQYKRQGNDVACPKCAVFPCVCMSRSDSAHFFRCRNCDHRFSVDNQTGMPGG